MSFQGLYAVDLNNYMANAYDPDFVYQSGDNHNFYYGSSDYFQCWGMAVDSQGNIFIGGKRYKFSESLDEWRIYKYDSDWNELTYWGGNGSGDGEFDEIRNIAIDSNDNVYVVDKDNYRVQKFSNNGTFLLEFGEYSYSQEDGKFYEMYGICIDDNDNVYVTDYYRYGTPYTRIQIFNTSGVFQSKWGTWGTLAGEFTRLNGIATDNTYIYIIDEYTEELHKYTLGGTYQTKISVASSIGRGVVVHGNYVYIGIYSGGTCYLEQRLISDLSLNDTNVLIKHQSMTAVITCGAYISPVLTDRNISFNSTLAICGGNYTIVEPSFNSTICLSGGIYNEIEISFNSTIALCSSQAVEISFNATISLCYDLYKAIPISFNVKNQLYLGSKARVLPFTDDGHLPFTSAGGSL